MCKYSIGIGKASQVSFSFLGNIFQLNRLVDLFGGFAVVSTSDP